MEDKGRTSGEVADLARGLPIRQSDDVVRLFGLRTILARPGFLAASPWLHHVPFAYWLMAAQAPRIFVEIGQPAGVSYHAFCQSADRNGIDVRCFSIPVTADDDPAPSDLEMHNAEHYAAFSSILRVRPEEAAGYFDDGSVDLLHLDGAKGYEAVAREVETWMPKLSSRAVLVLHGANLREHGAGVFRMVADLRDRFPVFELGHGQGLAIVGVGGELNDQFRHLFAMEQDSAFHHAIQTMFGRLGQACADAFHARHYRALYESERRRSARIEADGGGVAAAPAEAGLRAVERLVDSFAEERSGLLAQIDAIRQDRREAETRQAEESRKLRARLAERDRELREGEEARRDLASTVKHAEDKLAAFRLRIADLEKTGGARASELEQACADLREELARADERVSAAEAEAARQKALAERIAAEQAAGLAAAQEARAAIEAERERLRAEQAAQAAELERLRAEHAAQGGELEGLRAERMELGSELEALREALTAARAREAERSAAISSLEADLERQAEAARRAGAEAEARLAELAGAAGNADALRTSLQARYAELAALQTVTAEAQEAAEQARAETSRQLAALREDHARGMAQEEARRAAVEKQAAERAAEVARLKAALKAQEAEWHARYQEILDSTAWRATAPARRFVDRVRGRRPE